MKKKLAAIAVSALLVGNLMAPLGAFADDAGIEDAGINEPKMAEKDIVLDSEDEGEDSLVEEIFDGDELAEVNDQGDLSVLSASTFTVSTAEELTAAVAQINAATSGEEFEIYLGADISTDTINFNTSATVTLYGCGHELSLTRIHMAGSTTLNLGSADNPEDSVLTIKGSRRNDSPGVIFVQVNTTLNMYDGVTIAGAQNNNYFGGGVSVKKGTFNMYGGSIEDCGVEGGSVCFGGGVAVYEGGVFNMSGGSIDNCYATTSLDHGNLGIVPWGAGGGVFVGIGSTFNMAGGSITNCSASESGGGVFVANSIQSFYKHSAFGHLDSKFAMTGGSIEDCEAGYYGGGVCVDGYYVNANGLAAPDPSAGAPADPGVYLTSGTISGNSAAHEGGGLFAITLTSDVPCEFGATMDISNNSSSSEGSDIFMQGVTPTFDIDYGAMDVTYDMDEPADISGGTITGYFYDEEYETEDGRVVPRFVDQTPEQREAATQVDIVNYAKNGSVGLVAALAAKIAEYTVSFDLQGHGAAIDSQIVNEGDVVQEPQTPTADGYTFGGWYTDAACTEAYDFSAPVMGDVTLYAKWTQNMEAPGPGSSAPGGNGPHTLLPSTGDSAVLVILGACLLLVASAVGLRTTSRRKR